MPPVKKAAPAKSAAQATIALKHLAANSAHRIANAFNARIVSWPCP
jgi:hypothetical protein